MNEWIELNLPYATREYFDSSVLEYPDLEERAKNELGFNSDDVEKLYEKLPKYDDDSYNEYIDISDDITKEVRELLGDDKNQFRDIRVKKLLEHSREDIQSLGQYLNKNYQLENWTDKQPEEIAYREEYESKQKAFNEMISKKSFSGLGLNRAGVLIEVEIDENKTEQYLIGHINTNCGVCNDCCEFDDDKIVKRYKIVWTKEDK